MLGPLLAGCAAWLAWRNEKLMRASVLSRASRRPRAALYSLLGLLVAAVIPHYFFVLITIIKNWQVFGSPLDPIFLVHTLQPLGGYLSHLGLGYLLGSWINRSFAAGFIAVGTFVVPVLNWNGALPRLLWEYGGGTGVGPELIPRFEVSIAQFFAGAALCTLAVWLRPQGMNVRQVGLVAIATALLVTSVGFLFETKDSRFGVQPIQIALECFSVQMKICVDRNQVASVGNLTKIVENFETYATSVGFNWDVDRIEQQTPGWLETRVDTFGPQTRVILTEPALKDIEMNLMPTVEQLVLTPQCRFSSEYQAISTHPSFLTFEIWTIKELLNIPETNLSPEYIQPLLILSESDRAAWLAQSFEALTRCDSSALPS